MNIILITKLHDSPVLMNKIGYKRKSNQGSVINFGETFSIRCNGLVSTMWIQSDSNEYILQG